LENPSLIYAKSTASAECFLAQGEIISNLIHVHIELASLEKPPNRMVPKIHPLAVILSQGCDLEQDYNSRQGIVSPDKTIPTVLFCEVIEANVSRSLVKKSDAWNRIQINNDERYHFFQMVEPSFDSEALEST
jgi:hypothetical protein